MVLLGVSTPQLILGQSKFGMVGRTVTDTVKAKGHSTSTSTQYRPSPNLYRTSYQTEMGRLAARKTMDSSSSTGKATAMDMFKASAIQLAKWGAYALFGVEAMKYGMQQLRPEIVETTRQSSEEFGRGYVGGMQRQYLEGQYEYEPQQAALKADIYQNITAPSYQKTSVDKIWAEQQARYESNLAYPTFNTGGAEKSSQKIKGHTWDYNL